MAITKIKYLKASNGKDSHVQSTSLRRCLEYIINPEKTSNYYYVSGYNCNYLTAYQEMMNVKEINGKTWGRQGYHFIISFSPEEQVDEETVFELMNKFCYRYLKKDYQAVFSVHNDKNHLHAHLVFNSVNMMTGLKYRYNKGDWERYIQPIVNELCEEYNLGTISLDKKNSNMEIDGDEKKNLSYEKWKAKKNGTKSWGDIYREDIDKFVAQAHSFDEFVDLLQQHDYEIKNTGKYFGIRTKAAVGESEHKFRRMYRLGDDYSVDAIKRRIADNVKLEKMENDVESDNKTYVVRTFPTVIRCQINVKGKNNFNYNEYRYINPLKSDFVKRLYQLGCFRTGKISCSDKQIRYDLRHIDSLNRSINYICRNKMESIEDVNKRIDFLNARKKELYKKKKSLLKERSELKDGEADIYKGKILYISREINKNLDEVKICLRIKNEYENRNKNKVR